MMVKAIRNNKSICMTAIVALVVIIAALCFSMAVSETSISQNVGNRVSKELISTAKSQAMASEQILSKQYLPLQSIAQVIENGMDFDCQEILPMLQAMAKVNRLCMLGFADLNGDVVNYKGEKGGNISDRAYFSDIVNGSCTQRCEYLFETKLIDEPRVMFSIPVYRDGELFGVLFESKEVEILENALFNSELFSGTECIFICDSDFNVLVANECARDTFKENGCIELASAFKENTVFPIVKEKKAENPLQGIIDVQEREVYLAYTTMEVNDWNLFCKVSYDSAREAYASNLNVIRQLVTKVSMIFAVVLGIVVLLTALQIGQKMKEERILKHYYENYNILLREMNCALVEYDIQKQMLYANDTFFENYGIDNINGSVELFEKFKTLHPEFDFAELDKEIHLVIQERCTYSFETIAELQNHEIRWLKVILVPISNSEGSVDKIIVIVVDTTDIHSEFDKASEMLEQTPSGLHRCYLSNPIHLEYFSDGLCKMLGYTREEFYEKVEGNKYSNAICEEDKAIFRDFIRELAADGGTKSCEYRMVCKDGRLLRVTDIMDAKRSASGIMYGYSVVMDLSKYEEAQKRAEMELREMREQLEQTRMKVSSSQMQPHFLYNALASIRELVLEDPQYASDLIYDFTLHLRACIRAMASDNLISFRQEVENIRAYANIEKMRFGEKLKLIYNIEAEDFDIIPLSIQPLVENAIRHGIHERGAKGGTVTVHSYTEGNQYIVTVKDDGVGFNLEEVMRDIADGRRDSTGLVNLIYRFEKLMNAVVTVESTIGTGTKVTVKIPYREA